jgi:cytochrome c biogenesis protein CcmG/thiol:disulfide interchange protein DsbE
MSRFRPTFFIPIIAFLGLVIIGGLALQGTLSGSRNPNQLPSVLIGKPAPDVPLPLLQNSRAELALDAYRGQPLLVNFFASWCAPCRAEAPALEHLSNQISAIGIAYKDRPQDTLQFLEQYGNPFVAIGRDDDGRAGMAWGVYGVPETYLIDPSGQIKWRHAGPLTRDVITTQLLAKLAEMQ